MQDIDKLLVDFEAQRPAALARAVSIVENHRVGFDRLLATLHPRLGRARRIGITGPPGAGKSTISTLLVAHWRAAGDRVAVLAVDPTSPFTGGALLGDRIRMERVALDPGVFIRSMATRGSLGGLAASAREVADVLDGYGFDRVLIETVGVGQTELDIARTADSTVVVLVPESGDVIQTLKAGIMEIADIFAVNKADRPGADRLISDVELMLGLRAGVANMHMPAHHGVDLKRVLGNDERSRVEGDAAAAGRRFTSDERPGVETEAATEGRRFTNPARAAREAAKQQGGAKWTPPVLRTVGTKEEGIEALAEAIDRHFGYLEQTSELRRRRRARLRERVVEVAEEKLHSRLWTDAATTQWVDRQIDALEAGTTTPFSVAEELLRMSGELLTGRTQQ